MSTLSIKQLLQSFLRDLGENPDRDGLRQTPESLTALMKELTTGYDQSLEAVVNGAVFPAETDGMVIVRDIECYSLCEHHLLPFVGKVHVAYLPDKHIIV